MIATMMDIEAGGHESNNHESFKKSQLTTAASMATTRTGSNESSMSTASRPRRFVEDHKKVVVQDPHDIVMDLGLSNSNSNCSLDPPQQQHQQQQQQQQQQQPLTATETKSTRSSVEKAPNSGAGLPLVTVLANKAQKEQKNHEPQLLHPLLAKIPLQVRFAVIGILSNLLFMVVYNMAVDRLKQQVQPPVIYAVVYFLFIPASHFLVSLFVFGWPEKYLKSLLSNFPIGLTALAIGGLFTGYLDQVGFNDSVSLYIRDSFTFSTMPSRDARIAHEEGELYSSMVVLVVTSIWTYVLSVFVNSPPAKSQKKEL